MESSYQPILPGLPNDLALRCLAKIPHGYHGTLETVSKRWRDVLRSTDYSSYKAKEGWSGDWVFLLTENSNDRWIAYDPDADRWHPIPMIPRKEEYAWSEGFGCVCVGDRFLVIGGSYCKTDRRVTGERPFMTNQVFQFDIFTKEWSEAASMRTPRAYFGCCVMSGKVYVCGGSNTSHLDGLALAEVYNPVTNKWEELPRMSNNLMDCLSLSDNGILYAFTDQEGNVFDPSKWVWRSEQMEWPYSEVGRAEVQVTQDGQMYAYVENVVKRKDNGGEWHVVAKLPSVGDGYSRCKGVHGNGFVALGNELYFMGGTAVCRGRTRSAPTIQNFELDRCWIWDGKWRETRPLYPPACGVVKGFAALKETEITTT